MGAKYLRNITKILKSASGVLYGRTTAGTGRGEELSPSTARTLLSVYSTSQVDTALTSKADLVGGVIPTAQIPAIAITEYLGSVASQVSMLALDGDRGDWCLRSDLGTTWVLADDDSTLLASWVELNYPTAPVTSVAGRTGTVTLSNTDISGLGSLATQSGTFSGTSSGTNTGDQNLFSTIAVSGQSDVVADAAGDTLTLVAGTNITITTNATTNTITITNTASGLSGTGSVDNAALRADGTGGATLQNSAWIIADNATASPNNTVNHASLRATGGTTNVSVSIVPKGTGAFCLAVPDSTTTGGNARGANSVDMQRTRSSASQVASGANSIILGGENNTATGSRGAMVGGYGSTSSGSYESFAYGETCVASGSNSLAFGYNVQSNSPGCVALGYKTLGRLNYGLFLGAGQFAAQGDAQSLTVPMRNKTTSATPVALRLDDYGNLANRFTVPSGKLVTGILQVEGVKSDGSAIALYTRRIAIKNVGGTTTLIQNQTIGTDYEDNASTDLTVTADDTNDSLEISVTGIASETWRWNAVFDGIEIAYGT